IRLCLSASLQLQCDKREITAHIGGEFVLVCKYDTNRYLFSKKYWCRGESRNTCEILIAGRRGLFVKVTSLQFDDTGAYWVGIDKIYADIMTSVNVTTAVSMLLICMVRMDRMLYSLLYIYIYIYILYIYIYIYIKAITGNSFHRAGLCKKQTNKQKKTSTIEKHHNTFTENNNKFTIETLFYSTTCSGSNL
uniref:Immunoglobulin V-set domain-containing protein n=1 Tax=Lates calcarifer TaxID=8187 RepID=A0A4W6FKE7_LATCA